MTDKQARPTIGAASCPQDPDTEARFWEAAARDDKAAFSALVEPLLGDLEELARHEIVYFTSLGDLDEDWITPKELVGETLTVAWRGRRRKPRALSLKAWLSGVLLRTAERIARHRRRVRAVEEAVSLEDRVPPPAAYDDDEEFWEWYQPDDLTRYEDILPATSVTPEDVAFVLESAEQRKRLPALERRVLLLHDRQHLPLPEVAVILRRSVEEVRLALISARQNAESLVTRQEGL